MRAWVKPHSKGTVLVTKSKAHSIDKWHQILGHVNTWSITTLQNNKLVTGLNIDKSIPATQCIACIKGKKHAVPLPREAAENVGKPRDLTVSDVWGPAQIEGPARERYFFSFTDAKKRYSGTYFGKTKDEVLKYFEDWKQLVENQTGNKLKIFWSDNGGEYLNSALEFCAKSGIIMQTTAPYSHAQNGIAERLNRTLLEHVRAMLFTKNLAKGLWPEAMSYANYIHNRSPTRALGNETTPYQEFFQKKPDVSRLEEFGRRC